MNKLVKILALLCVASVLVASGCGGRCKVTGKVTYKDGTALTFGTVVFANETTLCKGDIDPQTGIYEMRTFKPGDGVPPGTYKIYLSNTTKFVESVKTNKVKMGDQELEMPVMGKNISLVPSEYTVQDQSPLGEITVKGKMTKDLLIDADPPEGALNPTEVEKSGE